MVEKIFSTCRHALGSETWGRVLTAMDGDLTIQSFPDMLASLAESMELPGYIADLTRDNLSQVLHLARLLEDRADAFTFNRLSTAGKGATLLMPEKAAFESFLREYDAAAAKNPKRGLKDNLINSFRQEKSAALFGGCTGHGCGAASNFLALLPDGEVHTCRKFPSLIGNITKNSFYDIYRSDLAERYRAGSRACRSCHLNPVCRGCLAIAFSLDLDIFTEKDPFCFASQQVTGA